MSDTPKPLEGLTILIVEDEYLIAMELAARLTECGGGTTKVASDVTSALAALAAPPAFDVAVIDSVLKGKTAEPLVEILSSRSIPFIVVTGLQEAALPPALRGRLRCDKPCDYEQLVEMIRAQCQPSRRRRSEGTLPRNDGAAPS